MKFTQLPLLSVFLITSTLACAQGSPVIVVQKYERTSSSIVVEGVANIIPPGTKMWATVISIDGKPLDRDRHTMKTVENVFVANDRSFKATIKRYGSLDAYSFPDGKYRIEFFAMFNQMWQTKEVALAAGIKLNNQGYEVSSEPSALPKSPDLPYDTILGERSRQLRAIRTIDIRRMAGEASEYKTKSIRIDILDINAAKNPVRSIPATDMLHREVSRKVGRLKPTEAVSLVCVGPFTNGFGYLANDLYFSGGTPNREFVTAFATTLSDLCRQQEDRFNSRNKH
ncbi:MULTISPECIES: hypothetical protein [Comamonas]|uniref:hypothetical protein n=1 Tax=Comamonas TaxID=283 RepID=UPI000B1699A8|nr:MULTISPECIES: hypothetical protein [Comamonas]